MTRKLILNVRCAWLLAGMGIRTNRLAGFCCIDQAGLVGFWLWLWAVWLWLLAPGKQRPSCVFVSWPPWCTRMWRRTEVENCRRRRESVKNCERGCYLRRKILAPPPVWACWWCSQLEPERGRKRAWLLCSWYLEYLSQIIIIILCTVISD